jgi:hypothetical protein
MIWQYESFINSLLIVNKLITTVIFIPNCMVQQIGILENLVFFKIR